MKFIRAAIFASLIVATGFAEGPHFAQTAKMTVRVQSSSLCPGYDYNGDALRVILVDESTGQSYCPAKMQWSEIRNALRPFVGNAIQITARIAPREDPDNGTGYGLALVTKVGSIKVKYPSGNSHFGFLKDMAVVGIAVAGSGGNPDVAAQNVEVIQEARGQQPSDTQQVDSAQPVGVQPPSQTAGGQPISYVSGVNQCISSFWDNSSGTRFYTFRNSCGQKINLRFVNRNGGGGSMDLEPGSKQSTGDTEYLMQKNGNYETYTCPYHFVAVDPYGNWFNRPVASFTCKPAGY